MPKLLRNLRIREVSSVDRGAGEGVKIMLMKRDFTADERKRSAGKNHAMPDGSFPIENVEDLKNAIQAVGRAKDPTAAKAHVKRRARALGRSDLIPESWMGKALDEGAVEILRTAFGVSEDLLLRPSTYEKMTVACDALGESIDSILKAEVDVDAGLEAIGKSLDQFVEHVAGFAPEIATAMQRGANTMATLKEQLQKAFAASTDAEKDVVRKELEGSISTLETSKAALETDVALWKGRALKATRLEKAAKDYANHPDNSMSEEETCKFLDLTETERTEYMKAHPIEVMTQKRIESLPEAVRKQLADGQAASEQVAKMQEERDVEAFSKRATELGQPAELGKSLRLLAKGLGTAEERQAAYDEVVKVMDAYATQAKQAGLFKEFGSGQTTGASAFDQLMAKAAELRETVNKSGSGKTLSPDQAFAKVYEDPAHRDLVLKYKEENPRAAA